MVNGLGFGTDHMDVCFILWFCLTRFRSRARFPEGLTLSIVTAIAETAQNLFYTTLRILVRFTYIHTLVIIAMKIGVISAISRKD